MKNFVNKFDKIPVEKNSRPSIFRTERFTTDISTSASFPTSTAIYRPNSATTAESASYFTFSFDSSHFC